MPIKDAVIETVDNTTFKSGLEGYNLALDPRPAIAPAAEQWPAQIEPNDDFQHAYRLILAGTPFIYITGKAGTGKSTLIHCLKSMIHKPYAIVAPTGVAALNAGGQTIHSFFRLPPRFLD